MSDSPDAQLLLKKRARRRLVGAVALAALAAVILPRIMDEEPEQQARDIQIRIPDRDLVPFNPSLGSTASSEKNTQSLSSDNPPAEPVPIPPEGGIEKPVEKDVTSKSAEKTPAKPTKKPADKAEVATRESEARRAEAILNGQITDTSTPAGGANKARTEQFAILIGAFSNPANVKQLQTKLGELGINVYTEPVGDKTRVRAGPFTNREAAEKALEKMKRIGVDGVVAVKQ